MSDEKFIRDKVSSIIAHRAVKFKTAEIGGEWRLEEIYYIHGTPKNVEFELSIVNLGDGCFNVRGKIHRSSGRLSITGVPRNPPTHPN